MGDGGMERDGGVAGVGAWGQGMMAPRAANRIGACFKALCSWSVICPGLRGTAEALSNLQAREEERERCGDEPSTFQRSV